MILSKSGLIDDEELTYNFIDSAQKKLTDDEIKNLGLIAMLLMNFRVVRMLFNGKFDENQFDREKLELFVYPKAINKKFFLK